MRREIIILQQQTAKLTNYDMRQSWGKRLFLDYRDEWNIKKKKKNKSIIHVAGTEKRIQNG